MLVYAHDENYNFVQVHLWEENKVSLTLNNNRTVQRCTIVAEAGKEFSNMDWNQVLIVYGDTHTSLYVDRLLCIIDGAHTLSDSYITSFTEGLDLVTVNPPMLPVAPSVLQPYTMLLVGGLPRSRGRNFRRLKRQTSRSFYNTEYPPILGCMRGFRVGNEVVDLQYGGIRPDDQYAVRIGCNTKCDEVTCHNSGHCTVDWQNLDPNAMNSVACDCSKTSYFGSSCSEDKGLTFEGQAAFVFDMVPILERLYLPTKREGDSFNFAFVSAVEPLQEHSRYLAVLQFAYSLKLEIILNKNGSVNAGLILPPLDTQVFTFLGNYSDGYRHFIQTTFRDKSITVIVDSVKHIFSPYEYQVTLETVEKIYLGGFETTNKIGSAKNFIGCISNADIDFHLADRFRFTPMEYYRNTGSKFAEFASTVPKEETLAIAQCANFKVPIALPPPPRTVKMPDWETPFEPQKYSRTFR
uniref:Laminin G domain-containing protein n=1 Tax=Plectus sambesii TaxID=2011161 RepID=A0A914VWA4_9BILA